MRIALIRFALTCLVCLGAAECLPAELVRAGSEFQVNTYTPNPQHYPSVSLDADGDFVVAWQSYGRDGSLIGVFARRFDFVGTPLATEFQVNTYTTNSQTTPSVALAGNGDFVIAWTSYNGQDGSAAGVFARRFNSSGTAQATEFQVNTYTFGGQSGSIMAPNAGGPLVAAETNGDFVVVWHDLGQQDGSGGGIFARRFDAAGTALAPEFQVNVYTSSQQVYPSVATDGDGDFVVSWHSSGQDGDGLGVFARRFASTGASVATEFQVNTRTFNSQRLPSVALESNGDYVVAWQAYGQDGPSEGIIARRFLSTGTGLAVEFRVNSYTLGGEIVPVVAMDADGDFVVAWQTYNDGDDSGIFSQRFDVLGNPVGSEVQINTFTENPQKFAAIGMNPVGDFVVAWQRYPDGGAEGIFAQRFDNIAVLDIDGNGAVTPLGDGVLILRFLFGFTGASLVNGTVDAELCQRCDEPTILAYLNTLI